MKIGLSEARRADLVGRLQAQFRDQFDEELSTFRAGEIVDLLLRLLGPDVYNQAVEDVRAHFQARLDDLSGEVYWDEEG